MVIRKERLKNLANNTVYLGKDIAYVLADQGTLAGDGAGGRKTRRLDDSSPASVCDGPSARSVSGLESDLMSEGLRGALNHERF